MSGGFCDIGFSCCLCDYCGLVLYITFVWMHFPSSGLSGFFLQLHVSACCVGEFKFERTCVLCDEMIDFMFSVH